MLSALRDYDLNIRLVSTEGICKLLVNNKIDEPINFMARLILLRFDTME